MVYTQTNDAEVSRGNHKTADFPLQITALAILGRGAGSLPLTHVYVF